MHESRLKLISSFRGLLYCCGVRSCVFLSDDDEFRWFRHHLVSSEWNLGVWVRACVRTCGHSEFSTSSMWAHWRKSCINWSVSCELLTQMWFSFFQRMSGKTRAGSNCCSVLRFYTALKLNWLIRVRILEPNIGEECLTWIWAHDSDTEAELVCQRA